MRTIGFEKIVLLLRRWGLLRRKLFLLMAFIGITSSALLEGPARRSCNDDDAIFGV